MNYFAHALPHLDRPYFLAGLAVPDWLSVADRSCRVRRRLIESRLPELEGNERELAAGILRHLDDDRWFHGSAAFYDLSGRLTRRFRDFLGTTDEWRCSFLGHIVLELLLDSALIEQDPKALDRYYRQVRHLDSEQIQQWVGGLSTHVPQRLAELIPLFVEERFLADYVHDDGLLRRLNQVLCRVGLTALPPSAVEVLERSRDEVRGNLTCLLPASGRSDSV